MSRRVSVCVCVCVCVSSVKDDSKSYLGSPKNWQFCRIPAKEAQECFTLSNPLNTKTDSTPRKDQ